MQIDEDAYLEHVGVKGMKWGVRRKIKRTARQQKSVDRVRRVATGTASKRDKLFAATFQIPVTDLIAAKGSLSKSGQRILTRADSNKAKIEAGKMKTTDFLMRLQGVNIRDLDFAYD
jgi:hypothetical protein